MKKLNNKGLSLIELLGVVTIMGILFGISILAYSRYISNSRNKAYFTLVQSAETAMNNYLFNHPSVREITFNELYEQNYLERPTDPGDKTKMCTGKVTVSSTSRSGDKLSSNTFSTIICCNNYYYTYSNNHTSKVKNTSCGM